MPEEPINYNITSNLFMISYAGNKRLELDIIINRFKPESTKYIIEPFCGTSIMSYAISQKYPERFTYILNDANPYLIELYKIMMDDDKFKTFNDEINKLVIGISRSDYYDLKGIYRFVIHSLFKQIHDSQYPKNPEKHAVYIRGVDLLKKTQKFRDNFLKRENIKISNLDGLEIYKKYSFKKNAYILLDPPYLMTADLYIDNDKTKLTEFYKYMNENDITGACAKVMLIVNDVWLSHLIYHTDYMDIYTYSYEKEYQTTHKHIKHLIITNYKL